MADLSKTKFNSLLEKCLTREKSLRRRVSPITALSAFAVTAATVAMPAFAYDAGTVTGGGTIEGKVVFNGAVQTRKIIPNKDVEVCGGIREEPLIEVGPDKGVKNAAVYLVEVAKGKAWPPAGKPPELDNIKCRFVPDVQMIPPVRWMSSTRIRCCTTPTAITATAPRSIWRCRMRARNFDRTDAPGTVRVDCDAHGWMEGWIYVVDNPYYALTGADGKFSITDVPPGTYNLVAIQSFTGP